MEAKFGVIVMLLSAVVREVARPELYQQQKYDQQLELSG